MLFNIEKRIFQIEAIIIAAALATIFSSVLIQVLVRVLGMNSIGTTEIGMVGMSILTFISTSAIMYTKDHITIEITDMIKSKKLLYWIDLIVTITMLTFGVVFLRIVYTFFVFTVNSGDKTLELGIPIAIPIGSMVLGMVLLIFHATCDLIKLFQTWNDKTLNRRLEE